MSRKIRLYSLFLLIFAAFFSVQSVMAVEVPPVGSGAYIQTSGPDTVIGIGDYYSTSPPDGMGVPHEFRMYISCDAVYPVVVALYDPEVFVNPGDTGMADEPRNNSGNTSSNLADFEYSNFRIWRPGGPDVGATYHPNAPTHLIWSHFYTIDPNVFCGEFNLTTWLSRTDGQLVNDDNSWRIKMFYDDGVCATMICTPSEIENATNDGNAADGTKLEIAVLRTTYQHEVGGSCQSFYFFVDDTRVGSELVLRNFDMDSNGSVTYQPPDGSTIAGNRSGGSAWAQGATGGVPIVPTADQVGWWSASYCISANNQYIFEAPYDMPVFFQQPAVPDMTITKDDGRDVVSINGENVTYTLQYENTGGGLATDVVISDVLPAGATFVSCTGGCTGTGPVLWNIGDVPGGSNGSVTLTVNLPAIPSGDVHINTVNLSYNDYFDNQYPPVTDTDIDVAIGVPSLTITKDDGRAFVSGDGEQVTYDIVVQNTGNEAALNVIVSDTLPPGALVDLCVPGCNPGPGSQGPAIWGPVTIASGASANYTITVTLPPASAGYRHVNTAQATFTDAANRTYPPVEAQDIDEVPSNTPMPGFTPPPNLEIVDPYIMKSANPPFAMPGELVTWTITVRNPGTVAFPNVTVTDAMPSEVEILSVRATSGSVDFTGQRVTFTQASLAPGASATITISTRVRDNANPPYQIRNTACLSHDQIASPLCADAQVVSAGQLPNTGETPRIPPVAVVMSAVLMMGVAGVWRFSRRTH